MNNAALTAEHPVEHGHGHDDHGHHGPANLHHHFSDLAQQRESNALGMWTFLITEVMTFGVLFFVYTLYRHLFEVNAFQMGPLWASPFAAGSHLLNNNLGFINTLVLLVSSLTMAGAVHQAGAGNRKMLVNLLVVTWILGFGFLGVKAVEWKADYDEGIVPGLNWNPREVLSHKGYVLAFEDGVNGGAYFPGNSVDEQRELAKLKLETTLATGAAHGGGHHAGHEQKRPLVNGQHMQMFFVIYFCMAGLHAIHMIIGLGLVGVFIWHAKNNVFTIGTNDQPVEILGLYWHFVDIVWVFLYPLLYLIAH